MMEKKYYPLLADSDLITSEELFEVRKQFRELPALTRNLLMSRELPQAIEGLVKKFDLDEPTIIFISIMIRKALFREWEIPQCKEEMKAWCQEIDQKNINRAEEIVDVVERDILTIVPKEIVDEEEAATENRTEVRIALLEALSRFPQLGQQTVTESRVKLKSSAEPTRGSLLNWIKCYREELGVGYHDSVTRGQFLFRSQNGAKLSDDDRDRISLILRSIEDGESLLVDSERQQIIFPERAPASKTVNTLAGAPERMPQFNLTQGTSFAKETSSDTSSVANSPKPSELARQGASPSLPKESRDGGQSDGSRAHLDEAISFGSTGSMRVKKSETIPSQQNGMLHFSSKHVLPAEKDLLVQNDAENTEAAIPTVPIQPKLAPKRNPSYIPNPFRIDPVNSGRPDEE